MRKQTCLQAAKISLGLQWGISVDELQPKAMLENAEELCFSGQGANHKKFQNQFHTVKSTSRV